MYQKRRTLVVILERDERDTVHIMAIRDLLRKKADIENASPSKHDLPQDPVPEFTFLRTTTFDQEVIQPPSYPGDEKPRQHPPPAHHGKWSLAHHKEKDSPEKPKRPPIFKRTLSSISQREKEDGSTSRREASDHAANSTSIPENKVVDTVPGTSDKPSRPQVDRKLSDRLTTRLRTLSRSSSRSSAEGISVHLPEDLGAAPQLVAAPSTPPRSRKRTDDKSDFSPAKSPSANTNITPADNAAREAEWEARATKLALNNTLPSSTSTTPSAHPTLNPFDSSSPSSDEALLQRAITLHESGSLAAATTLFSRLAQSPSSLHPQS